MTRATMALRFYEVYDIIDDTTLTDIDESLFNIFVVVVFVFVVSAYCFGRFHVFRTKN